MSSESKTPPDPVLYFSHAAAPLPLLSDKGHQNLISFIREITPTLGKPTAILVISAHWEENIPTITRGVFPALLYDYYGFPNEAYEIEYLAPGSSALIGARLN